MFKVLSVEELAEDAFIKAENVRCLEMLNTPTDYAKRKEAFVALALARAAAREAEERLTAAVNYKPSSPSYQQGLGQSKPQ